MISRLHDERVFMSSDDVVFSASTSQALRDNGDRSTRRPTSTSVRRRMLHQNPLEKAEEEESKSDRDDDVTTDEQEAPADDELDDEEEEDDDEDDDENDDVEEKRRLAGLKFPLQSPRHIASSQSYLHRQRRRMDSMDAPAASPAARRRQARQLLDDEHGNNRQDKYSSERTGVVTLSANAPLSKDLRRRQIAVQYHDHPMELVFLSTGEIRPRDECPAGLQLPATTDVRKLLDQAPSSPKVKEKVRQRVQTTLDDSAVHITRQVRDTTSGERWQCERPEPIETNGEKINRIERERKKRTKAPATSGSEIDGDSTESDPYRNDRAAARVKSFKPRNAPINRTIDRHDVAVSRPMPMASRHVKEKSGRQDTGSEDEYDGGKNSTSHARQGNSTTTKNLESELRKEKKRVLEKMSQLLEEQGKTQALQHQVQMLEDKVASMQKELDASARRAAAQHVSQEETSGRERDERIRFLSEEVRVKGDRIRRLESQLDQAETSTRDQKKDRNSPTNDDKIARLRHREASLAKQLEQLMDRVTEFHSQVECWKGNSRQALEGCDKRVDVLELMDRLWRDFPSFGSDPPTRTTSGSPEGESSTIAFLTKKLRQKEEALRLAKIKYVELKELCARKSIREADMQNYINEQRLRGNLVVRQTNDTRAEVTRAGAAPGRDQGNQVSRSNGQQTSTRRTSDRFGNQDAEADVDDDYEDEDDGEDRVVRRPQVFIDIKRSNQHNELPQESSPIEHVRLAPSPALAQRYRQLQQQQQHQQESVRQSTASRNASGPSGRTTRATVASASRTLATTRQALATRTTTTAMQKRTGRAVYAVSRTPLARGPLTSRRHSQAPTLTSRPWV